MKFNKYVTDKNNNDIYNGGSPDSLNSSCLCIFVIFIILIYILQNPNVMGSVEPFSTYNKTIDPYLVQNPGIIFNQQSKFKKKTYDSNINFSDGCDDDCTLLTNNIDKMHQSIDDKNPEMTTKQEWEFEKFSNNNNHDDQYSSLYDYTCNRPEFLDDKLNNSMLGRTWSYNHNDCNSLEFSQDNWSLHEGIVGDKGSNDSMVLPFRSLPENTVVENFENQSLLTYNVGKCSDRSDVVGFDQTSKCCYRGNEKASMFQNLDESELGNAMKLLDYAAGDVHHENLNNLSYNDIIAAPSFSNEGCNFP